MSRSLDSPSSELLSALSDAIGALVETDEHNDCIIEFEDSLDVLVASAQGGRLLSLRAALTPAGQPLDPQTLVDALSFNYTRMPPGYSTALDSATGQLMLLSLVDARRSSREGFLATVAGFLELLPDMRRQCAVPRGEAEASLTPSRVFG